MTVEIEGDAVVVRLVDGSECARFDQCSEPSAMQAILERLAWAARAEALDEASAVAERVYRERVQAWDWQGDSAAADIRDAIRALGDE